MKSFLSVALPYFYNGGRSDKLTLLRISFRCYAPVYLFALTCHTFPPASSATNSDPSGATVTPTGRP
jgi:hypothetical protein